MSSSQNVPALSSQVLHRMLHESSDAILLMTYPMGDPHPTITYINRTLLLRTGFFLDELLGESPEVLLHASVRQDHFLRLMHRMQQGKNTRDTVKGTTRDGQVLWTELTISLLEGDMWLMVARDVTQQVQYQQESLQRAHQLEQMLHHAGSVLQIISRTGDRVYTSPSCMHLFGYTAEEMQDLDYSKLVHPEDLALVLEARLQLFQQDEGPSEPMEYRIITRAREERWVSSVVRRVELGPEDWEFHLTTMDITDRKWAELRLHQQLERYRALLDLTYQLETVTEPDVLSVSTLEFLLPLTEFQCGSFVRVSEEGLSLIRTLGKGEEEFRTLVQQVMDSMTAQEVPGNLPALSPVFFSNRNEHHLQTPLGEQFPSVAILPIVAGQTLCGVMFMGSRVPQPISDSTRRLCTAVTERVSLGYHRLLDLERLKEAREETLRAMGLVLEYRDFETKGHTDRVVQLSERLGQAVKLDQQQLDALRFGAYLHDVGKVAIPDQVLLKPERLNSQDWGFIQQHPGVGYDLLHHIPTLPTEALEVVLYHQERWNGSGYPKSLKGQDIPLLARLFAVVDVYDALVSERPYKPAWSHQEAVHQLREEAGTLLDPDLVEAFLKMLNSEQKH
ncbi:HD domain-containing phosphohydrolase [Deinococcus roseus]|uniref:Histidine kinase n=1 Tax=Deinococcus roseus TaxID=392414 RepID=A0ABQ2D615_9DEIO|nr:HD domain-containing phosphohydrolase [Deinococcus roseus]GGJ47474.1 hypothetical protein GCM10008938_36860 [Deinococcus roseus]